MNTSWKNEHSLPSLQCLSCRHVFSAQEISLTGISCSSCRKTFPVVSGIPIMIDEDKSIFTQAEFLGKDNLFFDLSRWGKVRAAISQLLPGMVTTNTTKYFKKITAIMNNEQKTDQPRVLVLGGSVLGGGMKQFIENSNMQFVQSDVSFGPQTEIVLDAHAIPYANESFNVVIVQAVLEHVIDPGQCVSEIWRVLKTDGIVFADTPFMQQVHGGAYDFTRFTQSGQRKLFAHFKELESGSSSGSGSVMAWSYCYLLLGLFGYTPMMRYLVKAFARITGFWMKYFDYLEVWNPRRADGASGIYFLGRKSLEVRLDRDIIAAYHQR